MANYNVQKMITSGREIMANNSRRDITMVDIKNIMDSSSGICDVMFNSFLFGVALGVRIGKAEGGRPDE